MLMAGNAAADGAGGAAAAGRARADQAMMPANARLRAARLDRLRRASALTAAPGSGPRPPRLQRIVKLAVVVQRYGADVNGGAELHARYIAERLARHAQVEVLTTCARNYVTWRNELPAGVDRVNGIPVRRFPVRHERHPLEFGRRSQRVFEHRHSIADELAWLDSEGPTSPALISHLARSADSFDYVILFSYRYYLAWHGARRLSQKAVLVPTAERDPAIGLGIFGPVFRGVRGIMYNSHEERAMIQAATNNQDVPGVVVGVGSDVPDRTDPARFRRRHRINRPFAIYIGRIDENKGCTELFDYFQRYAATFPHGLDLVLVGNPVMPIPRHKRIHHLGFLSDEDKFDALAAADLLVMPSYFESLSMVALEAWALGRPVLANGRCDVLKGQCIRSGAGLYYESYQEFAETLYSLESNGPLHERLGRNGREYFKGHYAWPVIERKYLDMLERLRREPAPRAMEPLGGWLSRRQKRLPAAADVLVSLPSGAAEQPA
jgi:glycosyltransferase involved in cell wall biosynthesis